MEFPDYSGIFKPDSGFKDKYPGFDPWSKENTSPSGPDFSKSSDDRFGETFKKWGEAADLANKWRNKDNNFGFSGGGVSGGRVQGHGDLTVVYPDQREAYTIAGKHSPWGTIGGMAGTVIGGLFGGPAGAAIGGSFGGAAGGLFG